MSQRITLTLDETADLLGVARATAYKAARAGQLPSIRVGRRLLVPVAALEALLRNPQRDEARTSREAIKGGSWPTEVDSQSD